jgi:prevent-host-death family protein
MVAATPPHPQDRPLASVTATEAKSAFGTVLDRVQRGDVITITKHDKPSAVLLSIAAYEELLAQRADPLAALRAEFDRRVAQMQTPRAKAGVRTLFAATPAELGRAAVKAARKRG